jgi:PAS domain S-box-containing protein
MLSTVGRFRLLLVLGAVLYPLWGVLQAREVPGSDPGLPGRFVLGGMCLAILGASFLVGAVRRHIETAMVPAAVGIVAHYAYVVGQNDLHIAYALSYILTVVILTNAFESRWPTLVVSVASGLSALLPQHDGAAMSRRYFVTSVVTFIVTMTYALRHRRRLFHAARRMNEGLQAQKELLAQVLDHIPQGIYAKDATAGFRYVIWNHAMERLSGRPRAEVLGKTDHDFTPPVEAARQRRVDAFVMGSGQPLDVPEEEVHPGTRPFPAHTVRIPVVLPGGATQLVLGAIEDITEAKEREALIRVQQGQLIHASKMSTLGEMSGGVAHEINNPLTVIMGFAQRIEAMVAEDAIDPAELARCGERIVRMTERIARIIRGLRTFAREASADPFETVPLARLISDTLELCQQRFVNYGVKIEVGSFAPELAVECRAVQISQVLLNLLSNAFDAVQSLSDRWVQIDAEDLGTGVRIAVTDSGAGIAPEIAAKMLHPFFTTKSVGEGTGLGLSIARGIVESHGGRFYYDPNAPHTRFAFELPKHQKRRHAA